MRKCLAAALCLLPFAAPAQGVTDPLIALFTRTCMQTFEAPAKLHELLATAPKLEDKYASVFLRGTPGTAWALHTAIGNYIVALNDDGICLVAAQHADVDAAQRDFVMVVSEAPAPMVVTPNAKEPDDLNKYTSYSWHRPGMRSEVVFTLTTSTKADAATQGQVTMGLFEADEPVTPKSE